MGRGGRPSLLHPADTPSDWERWGLLWFNRDGWRGTKTWFSFLDPEDKSFQINKHMPALTALQNKGLGQFSDDLMGISPAIITNKEAYETNWKDGFAVPIFKEENNWLSQGQGRTRDCCISFPAMFPVLDYLYADSWRWAVGGWGGVSEASNYAYN